MHIEGGNVVDRLKCPVEEALRIVGKKWIVLIVKNLVNGPMRFCALESALHDITPLMLSNRLKDLEKHNIVKRKVYTEAPIRVEYELTGKGHDLEKVIDGISEWGAKWL